MPIRHISVGGAPKSAGPYSHAVITNNFVFVSGQGPINPENGQIPRGFSAQAYQALENLKTILEGAGSSIAHVVKVNVYLSDLENFDLLNAVYLRCFQGHAPARTTLGCALKDSMILLDCIATVKQR